jgi:hypothetical protein
MNKWTSDLFSKFFKTEAIPEEKIPEETSQYDLLHFNTDGKVEKVSADAMSYSNIATIKKTNYKTHTNSYDNNLISFNSNKNVNVEEASVSNTPSDMTISFNRNKVDKNEISR